MAVGEADRPVGETSVPAVSLRRPLAPFDSFRGILGGAVETKFDPLNESRGAISHGSLGDAPVTFVTTRRRKHFLRKVTAKIALQPSRIERIAASIGVIGRPSLFFGEQALAADQVRAVVSIRRAPK